MAETEGTSKGHCSLKAHPSGGSGRVHKIDSLTPEQTGWRIKARVIHKSRIRPYSNSRREGKLFVVTLTDDSAEIKATGFNNAVDNFYEVLEVNKVYYFSEASLKVANKQYTTIQNVYEMDFNTDTIIEPCEDDSSLPRTTNFNFVKINELNSKTPNSVVDVIGVVKTCADVTTTIAKQKEVTKRDLQLVDQSGMSVSLTLWGADAQQFDGSNHPVIAVKGARVSYFEGLSLSATPFSQIVHNPNLQEGHMLKDWFEHDSHNMDFQGYRNDGMRGGGGDSEISHEQLEEYMRTGGKTTVRHALGVVVGCGGAGKTTLLYRLMGKNDNEIEEIKSTRGLEIHEHIFVVKDEDMIVKDDADSRKRLLGVSRHALESIEKNSDPIMDYSTAKGNIKNKDALESNEENCDPAMDYSTTKGNIKKNDDPAKRTVSKNLNSEGTSKETRLPESEKDAMKDILQTVRDETTVSMIDFAGQFAYYACHQIYMRSKAFFILVLDINQSFKENGEHYGCTKDSNIYDMWTSKEYTEFWLNSIKSFGGENAPVLLVLTHTEGKSEEDVKNFKEGFWESLSDEVKHWLHKSTDGNMFEFGLKEMDESSKKSLQSLKTSMVDIVSRKLNAELELPSSWALFEYFLKGKEDPILSIEDVRKINMERPEEYRLGNASENAQKEISDFLSFLHGHGFLLYFDEDILNTRIILRMQWFSDAFSKLITDKPAECSTIYIKEWKRFDKTGELKNELVEAIWKDEQYSKHKIELMAYMAKLKMLVDVGSLGKDISWYVPCMNKKPFQQHILEGNWEYTSILSFRLNSFALFEYFRLVAYCMSKWSVETDKDDLCLYHTAAMFENKNHTVLLGIHGNDIQVQVRRIQDLDSEVSIETGKYVQNALDELTKTFNEGKTYERGYKCLNIFCNDKDQTFIPARNFTEIKGNSLQCCCPIEEKHQVDVKKTVGYWEQCPQSRKRKLENSTDSQAKTKFANHGQTYPFSKNGPQIDVMTSRIKAEVSESVGLIFVAEKEGIGRGTGFRVGNKYIMTCLHVVKDIIEVFKDECRIDCRKIEIRFGMVDPRATIIDQQTVFYFEPTLCQHKEFDLAILELKHEVGKSFPRQLTLSGSLNLPLPVHLIGHPGGVEMKEDSGVNLYDIQPNNDVDKYINKLSQWSKISLPENKDYYSVLRDHPRKILFSTTFDEGSSGAPGIMIQHYKPYVVVMVSGAVPDCHYKNVCLVQHEERIEFGYAMKDIGEEMDQSSDENIRKIAAEIFSPTN